MRDIQQSETLRVRLQNLHTGRRHLAQLLLGRLRASSRRRKTLSRAPDLHVTFTNQLSRAPNQQASPPLHKNARQASAQPLFDSHDKNQHVPAGRPLGVSCSGSHPLQPPAQTHAALPTFLSCMAQSRVREAVEAPLSFKTRGCHSQCSTS